MFKTTTATMIIKSEKKNLKDKKLTETFKNYLNAQLNN